MEIVPATSAVWPDLAELFESVPTVRWCWCQYFRVRGLDWTNSSAASNRERMERLTAAGPPPGLVAFRDGRAVGWVSLGPREAFGRLEHAHLLARVDERPVWSIVCFVVSRRARRSGVAAALLEAAIAYARESGATLVEAYPVDTGGAKVPASSAYHGTLSMFERAGFAVVARRRWNRSTPVRPIVRLVL